MKSGKQKAKELRKKRADRKLAQNTVSEIRINPPIKANKSKLHSHSCMPIFPEFYRDQQFTCRDCGCVELWTPAQQQWWYEIAGGAIESTAIRCRPCRIKERIRKTEARKIHLAGIKRNKPNHI